MNTTHKMHQNSLFVYGAMRHKLSMRAKLVLSAFIGHGIPATDREIMKIMRFNDPNAVRPRITELIKNGHLVECGNVLCQVGGRTVRVCRVKRFGEMEA